MACVLRKAALVCWVLFVGLCVFWAIALHTAVRYGGTGVWSGAQHCHISDTRSLCDTASSVLQPDCMALCLLGGPVAHG